ncbi:MAG: tRNA (adenosine(37)-N6)-threonylcarbamoyltransferase complex ATPase subunit type 1 TsaE [Actinomycetes bacterium]|jgi:tRNA threonylcarbamoyladenosine biosynthesis protein TsaE|nr:tRNA (adenosine(37)-N6)-threonylcarbamoyltransferase complex ATPase subunit type 1 TsaE [Actinomycetes bacterium]
MTVASTSVFHTNSPIGTQSLGERTGAAAQPGEVWLLIGDLGAGKTQFAQGFAAGLGVTDDVISPTYPILVTYTTGRTLLNHIDFYRLEDESQLADIDFDSCIAPDAITLIEWGDRFAAARRAMTGVVNITIPDPAIPDKRRIEVIQLR